jgi:peptidoglycan/xylan/chitin deacetylase (PgdA/CDA1 family)
MRSRASWLLAAVLLTTLVPASALAADGPAPFPWPPTPWASERPNDAVDVPDAQRARPFAAPVVRKGPAASGAVALTFDDGYNRRACMLIADKLRQHGAVGTFFINGQWLVRAPDAWRRILEGMEVGNHTRSHPDLTREPHPVVINQIRSNEVIHERVLGRPMLKVFRPPYGAHSERIGRIAAQLDYERVVLWNVDTEDWKPKARVDRIVRRATGAPPGSIILMHCGPGATVKAVPEIIRHYQQRGIRLEGLSVVLRGARSSKWDSRPSRYGEAS